MRPLPSVPTAVIWPCGTIRPSIFGTFSLSWAVYRWQRALLCARTPLPQRLQIGNYAWLGGTLQVYGFFFPTSVLVPDSLRNRLNLVLTYQGYWDANSNSTRSISRYAAELAYNITENGNASVSVGYEHGINKDTMTFLNQYVVKLNYKY